MTTTQCGAAMSTCDDYGLRRSFALRADVTRFVWDNQDVLLETNAGGVTRTADIAGRKLGESSVASPG